VSLFLNTGVDGTGKTLDIVDAIEHEPLYKDRTIYAHAIEEWARAISIRCSHPGCRACRKLTSAERATMPAIEQWQTWAEVGALIVVDEAHYAFPQRREAATPEHVLRLTEHRHDGVDFWLATINVNLVDINVRRVVKRHTHFVQGQLGRWKFVHTECMTDDAALRTGTKERHKLPKRSFGKYKSSDGHTKMKFKIPAVVLKMGAIFIAGLVAVSYAWGMLSDAAEKPVRQVDLPVEDLPVADPSPLSTWSDQGNLVGVGNVRQVMQADILPASGRVAACLALPTRCSCYDDDAFPVETAEAACRAAVAGEINPRSLVDVNGRYGIR